MPFVDSLFMPREPGDRPDVIPAGATNFAFLGERRWIAKGFIFSRKLFP
jgi:oleate hydratase